MPTHGTREATADQTREKAVREFTAEIGGDPPGERPLIPQLIGWSYHLTAIGLAIVTLRESLLAGSIDLATARNALAVGLFVWVGFLVDNEKQLALWPGIALSGATVYTLGPGALDGDVLHAAGAITHAILLLALPAWWLTRNPQQPA